MTAVSIKCIRCIHHSGTGIQDDQDKRKLNEEERRLNHELYIIQLLSRRKDNIVFVVSPLCVHIPLVAHFLPHVPQHVPEIRLLRQKTTAAVVVFFYTSSFLLLPHSISHFGIRHLGATLSSHSPFTSFCSTMTCQRAKSQSCENRVFSINLFNGRRLLLLLVPSPRRLLLFFFSFCWTKKVILQKTSRTSMGMLHGARINCINARKVILF